LDKGIGNGVMVVIAQIALGVIIGLTVAAEPTGKLTLACEGTAITTDTTDKNTQVASGMPMSTAINVDFEHRTVEFDNIPASISQITETTITFRFGTKPNLEGTINRVTGAVEVNTLRSMLDRYDRLEVTYSLKCKPAQRMF
jgi:hypothetical protein